MNWSAWAVPATVIGVEPSPEAIEIATARLESRGATFVQGEADSLVTAAPNADVIFFCNAIHLVPDKRAAMGMIAQALAPHGFFACNSSFYQGAYAPGSERFYHLWTRRALGWLRKNHPGVRTSRRRRRPRCGGLPPTSMPRRSKSTGYRRGARRRNGADAPARLAGYWPLLALHRGRSARCAHPLGADALEHSAAEALQELGLTEVPRVWLQLVAQRTSEGQ